MKSTQKGNQRHFGMKARIGVDAGTGMGHSVAAAGANVHDQEAAPKLIRPYDDVVNGSAGYAGIEEREKIKNDGPCLKSITGLTSGRELIRSGMISYWAARWRTLITLPSLNGTSI
jgi:hypothetical protein